MTIAVIDPPSAEPLTLALLKAHLRLDDDVEDDLLASLIRVAREYLEQVTGLALMAQRLRLYRDSWPNAGMITLERGPVLSVDAVRLYDELGDESLLSLDGHVLDGKARPPRLYLRHRPAPGQALNGIEVDFTAGFGEAATDVPDGLCRAMLVHAAHMYEFRGAVPLALQPASIPDGYDRLIAPWVIRRL